MRFGLGWVSRLGLAVLLAMLAGRPANATPHDAHLHYQIGVRANAGGRHAAIVHLEAGASAFDAALARDDTRQMRTLALEIESRVARIERNPTRADADSIAPELRSMAENARAAARLATALEASLDSLAGKTGVRRETALPLVAARARELFATFKCILAAHKRAETKLGIPMPPDPPAPPAGGPCAGGGSDSP